MPSDALVLLYGLTPAELRVFELIAAGVTQIEIADWLGIAASTVKSCKRQADLVKLAASLLRPI